MQRDEDLTAAPAGYQYHGRLFGSIGRNVPRWRVMALVNFLALLPLSVAALVVWLPQQIYVALGSPLALFADPDLPQWGFWVIGAVIIVASMILHELLHGLALLLTGHTPRFGYARGFLYASMRPDEYLNKRQYLLVTLMPLVSITLVSNAILLLLPPGIGQALLIAVLLNAAASVGDLMVTWLMLRSPTGAIFSERGGILVFVPVAVPETV